MQSVNEFLKEKIDREALMYFRDINDFPQAIYKKILEKWGDDTKFNEKHRFDLLELLIADVKSKKILDMAAGCGSFVIQGLKNGYNTYGVEPEVWKHALIDLKFSENSYPEQWRSRVVRGVGEKLPFESETFDVFDSWQTIEHVQDEKACLEELFRVLKKGGKGILRGPDYICFFEGHYRMFWLPLLNPKSKLAKLYVKFRGRPLEGLQTFHAVNPFKTRKFAKKAGFKIIDIKRLQIYNGAKRRFPFLKMKMFFPLLVSIYAIWDFLLFFRYFGRGEATISYLLIKPDENGKN